MYEDSIIPCCPYTYTEELIENCCHQIDNEEKFRKKNIYNQNNNLCCFFCLCIPCAITIDLIKFPFYVLDCCENKNLNKIQISPY
jgi:hypothetical protein